MSYMQPSRTRKPPNSPICWLSKTKIALLMTVTVEMVVMAKFRSELPQDYLAI